MKILFVFPNNQRNNWRMPLGLGYLMAAVRAAGHEPALLDTTAAGTLTEQQVFNARSFAPAVACISVMSTNVTFGIEIARRLKRAVPGLVTLIGGIHATVATQDLLACDAVDYVCVGEGELAIARFFDKLSRNERPEGIPGIIAHNHVGDIVPAELPVDLGRLPWPDRALFDRRHQQQPEGMPVLTARGCPFACTYCVNPIYRRFYGGQYVRLRPLDDVLAELRSLRDDYRPHAFFIQDETFFMDHDRVREFCLRYPREIGIPFNCMGQATQLTEEILRGIAAAGGKGISIGIESGNPELRRDVLGRVMSDEQIAAAFAAARAAGLRTHSFNIIGLPGETRQDVQTTLDLNIRCRPNTVQFTIMAPFPGTTIREHYCAHGWLVREQIDCVYGSTMISTPELPAPVLLRLQRELPWHYYFRQRPWWRRFACAIEWLNRPGLRIFYKELVKLPMAASNGGRHDKN